MLTIEGDVTAVLGGEGEGPGEYSRIGAVVPLASDSFLVSDGGNMRVTLYDSESYAFDRRFEVFFSNALYDPTYRSPDGVFLLTPMGFLAGALEDGNTGWRAYPMLTTRDFVSVDTLAMLGLQLVGEPGDRNPVRHFGFAVRTGNQIAHATSDRPQITWIDLDGRVTQIARWDAPLREVTDADWEAYEGGLRSRYPSSNDQARFEQTIRDRHRDFGGVVPLFRYGWGDSEGNVWLSRYDMAESTVV